jgi:hypothetical protein
MHESIPRDRGQSNTKRITGRWHIWVDKEDGNAYRDNALLYHVILAK